MFGLSSGGALVLEAAIAGVASERLAIYEAPYDTSEEAPARLRDYLENLRRLLSDGRRSDALVLFMRLAGSPDADI